MELKAKKILKKILKEINDDNLFLSNDFVPNLQITEAIEELEALESQDKLAELEKVILDCYLVQGYQIGVGSWDFNVEIESDYKSKSLLVYFREYKHDNYSQVFKVEAETTKEMFDKAIDFFNLWSSKLLELQNDKRR